MNNLLSVFQENLKRFGVSKKTPILIAVSGGLDSVVLAECCFLSGLDFAIAHVNFQLRGEESHRDESFVIGLAKKLNKKLFLKRFDTAKYAEDNKLSIQVAARVLRYNWFETLLKIQPENFKYLVTAHHLDDNIETMLMNFFRGTGINGMQGMPEKNSGVIRPLLSFPRSTLEDFAAINQLSWVDDSSNFSNDYTRNYLRNEIIPSLEKIFPELRTNLENNLMRFYEVGEIYRQAIDHYKSKLLIQSGVEIHIPILLLKKIKPLKTICFEILKDYHFTASQITEVMRLMESKNGSFMNSPTHRLIKNRKWFIIAPEKEADIRHFILENLVEKFDFNNQRISMTIIENRNESIQSKTSQVAMLDADKVDFPLLIRKWKTGDYFYPLGMEKKKKLGRFFIDQKLSKTAKENTWVITMDSQILWVVGQRIDNRFRVTPKTRRILIIKNEDVSAH